MPGGSRTEVSLWLPSQGAQATHSPAGMPKQASTCKYNPAERIRHSMGVGGSLSRWGGFAQGKCFGSAESFACEAVLPIAAIPGPWPRKFPCTRSSGTLDPPEALTSWNRGAPSASALGDRHRGLPFSSSRGVQCGRVGEGSTPRESVIGHPLLAMVSRGKSLRRAGAPPLHPGGRGAMGLSRGTSCRLGRGELSRSISLGFRSPPHCGPPHRMMESPEPTRCSNLGFLWRRP